MSSNSAIHDGPVLTVQLGVSPTSFTDRDGDSFKVVATRDMLSLLVLTDDDEDFAVDFYKSDAAKIISLIAEAAK